jgi:hypothetical protein
MEERLSSCPNRNNIIRLLRCICLSLIIAVGFIAVIATGGGGDGDGRDGDNDPCDYNADIDCGDDEWKDCVANTGNPAYFVVLNDKLVFTAFSGCKNIVSTTMFEMDNAGTITEVFELASYDLDDQDSPFSSPQNIRSLVVLNNVAYFSWMTSLYKYDGVNPVQTVSSGIASPLMSYNNKLYYTVYDNNMPPGPGFGGKLYSHDGSNQVLIGDVSGTITTHYVYNAKLYMASTAGLYCYDDTLGLNLLTDMNLSESFSYCGLEGQNPFINFQDKLFFAADDGTNGNQFWMIDSENNVSMITNMAKINTYLDSFVSPMEVFQEKLLCLVYESDYIKRIWAYDGVDINPIPVDAPYTYVTDSTILNDRYYFLGPESSGNLIDLAVLWSYDGLNAPVKIETDEYLRDIFSFNGKLLLRTEERLLIYDGISQPQSFAELGYPVLDAVDTIINFKDANYITGESEEFGNELWKIDNSGTITLVKDFYPGVACSCENDE